MAVAGRAGALDGATMAGHGGKEDKSDEDQAQNGPAGAAARYTHPSCSLQIKLARTKNLRGAFTSKAAGSISQPNKGLLVVGIGETAARGTECGSEQRAYGGRNFGLLGIR